MILEKLLNLDYYTKKLSLSMQNSYGVIDQFEIFTAILNNINSILNDLFEQLDVNGTVEKLDDVLDKIASFYGLNRFFLAKYTNPATGQTVNRNVTLSNDELLMLIKATIIKNHWQGTAKELNDLYSQFNLPIFVKTNDEANAKAIYYIRTENPVADNILDMFYMKMLSVESMGITYYYLESNDKRYAIWDSDESTKLWDEGWWL